MALQEKTVFVFLLVGVSALYRGPVQWCSMCPLLPTAPQSFVAFSFVRAVRGHIPAAVCDANGWVRSCVHGCNCWTSDSPTPPPPPPPPHPPVPLRHHDEGMPDIALRAVVCCTMASQGTPLLLSPISTLVCVCVSAVTWPGGLHSAPVASPPPPLAVRFAPCALSATFRAGGGCGLCPRFEERYRCCSVAMWPRDDKSHYEAGDKSACGLCFAPGV